MKAPDSVARGRRVEFEVARFEVMGDCCQLQGRWFGVRGRRFMRPALTADVDGQSIRLLADLADKPWTAKDGEPWQATFPYTVEHAQLQEAELTVAPDVTITLPAPQRPAGAGRKKPSARRPDAAPQPSRRSALGDGGGEADALTRELAEVRKAHDRLRRQLDRLEADKAQTARRLDDMSRRLREVMHERDDANAARGRIAAELEAGRREWRKVAAELDALHRERSEIVAERDVARRERDQMTREREAAQRAHHEAPQERDAAAAVRYRPVSVRWVRWR